MPAAILPLTIPDLVCENDLDPFGRETTSDLQTLIQDVYHLLKEWPGSNPDDPDRGIGVDQYLSGTANDLGKMCSLIEAQLSEDDRIDSAKTTLDLNADGSLNRILVTIAVGSAVIPLAFGWQDGQFTTLAGGGI